MATTKRMTQTQLVRSLAEAGELTNKQARGVLDSLSQTGDQRSEEERSLRAARHRPARARGSQGPHGTQPGDRRIDQDCRQEGREVPRREVGERRDRSAKGEEGLVISSSQKLKTPQTSDQGVCGVYFCFQNFSRSRCRLSCWRLVEAHRPTWSLVRDSLEAYTAGFLGSGGCGWFVLRFFHGLLEVPDAFAEAFGHFRELLAAKQNQENRPQSRRSRRRPG